MTTSTSQTAPTDIDLSNWAEEFAAMFNNGKCSQCGGDIDTGIVVYMIEDRAVCDFCFHMHSAER